MPLSDAKEAELLDSSALYGQTLYLRLLHWTGVGSGNGKRLNGTAGFPAGLAEVSTGGYAPLQVLATAWAAAEPGAPSQKQVPKTGGQALAFSPTGGATWFVPSYAWTTDTNPITTANFVSGGVMLGPDVLPTVRTVDAAHPLNFTDVSPIIERLGDPPPGVNPT